VFASPKYNECEEPAGPPVQTTGGGFTKKHTTWGFPTPQGVPEKRDEKEGKVEPPP